MKIGILSMQRIINNGSLLQAYGLKKIIESLGNTVQFVDFKVSDEENEIFTLKEKIQNFNSVLYTLLVSFRNLLKFGPKGIAIAISNHKVRNNFLNNYMSVLNLSKEPNYSPKVDVLVFGSDEVFNTVQYVELGKGYAWQLYGADNNAGKLVSYAASFGHTTYKGLEKYNMLDKSRELLSKFAAFSVRDRNSYDIIKRLTGKEASINIDPVLLYDFADIEIKQPKIKDYILIYGYPGRINDKQEVAEIKAFAKKYNKKLVCVNMMQAWCDEFIYAHPFDLLGYFKYADYVVTDTFHGAVISIKYNIPFIQFVRESKGYSNNQKVGYLLSSFGLEDRILQKTEELEEVMLKPIAYEKVNEILISEKTKAMNYLKRVLQ